MPRYAAVAVAGAVLLSTLVGASRAEGPAKQEKGGVFPVVVDVQKPEEAKSFLDALARALEAKDEPGVVSAAQAMVTKRHKDFVPELKKLVADKRVAVAAAAAAALGSQADKTVAPLLMKSVTTENREKGYIRDAALKAEAIEALGRLGVTGGFDAIMKLTVSMLRDPDLQEKYAGDIVRATVRYLGLTKDKRGVSFLIDQIEEPGTEPVTPTTPPAAFQKLRHIAWERFRSEVPWALKEITGKEFENARRWRGWFDTDGKKEGMK